MPVMDQASLPIRTGSTYPEPYAALVAGRSSLRLGEAGGLTQFGANLVILAPGALASMRHWHEAEDEFVMVTQGECTLVEDAGETVMRPGDCAAFPAGRPDGHHLVNRSDSEARFLVVGTKAPRDVATYADVDFRFVREDGRHEFTYRDGTPWAGPR